jgi:S1-C subfamily serine protease
MDWDNYVVKLNVKSKVIDFNHPLNVYETQNTSGTGFFINKKEILTCYHVVSGAINIDILFKQTNSIQGKIKHIFPDDDLAIVEIDTELPDIKILEHKIINSRQSGDVFTVGFPLSSTNIKITKRKRSSLF